MGNSKMAEISKLLHEGSKLCGYQGTFDNFHPMFNEEVNHWSVFNFKDESPTAMGVIQYVENHLNQGMDVYLGDLNEF